MPTNAYLLILFNRFWYFGVITLNLISILLLLMHKNIKGTPLRQETWKKNVATQLTFLISIDNMQAHTDTFQLLLIYQSLITN